MLNEFATVPGRLKTDIERGKFTIGPRVVVEAMITTERASRISRRVLAIIIEQKVRFCFFCGLL